MLKEQHQHCTFLKDKSALHVVNSYISEKEMLSVQFCAIHYGPARVTRGLRQCCLYNKKKLEESFFAGTLGIYCMSYMKQHEINMMSEH